MCSYMVCFLSFSALHFSLALPLSWGVSCTGAGSLTVLPTADSPGHSAVTGSQYPPTERGLMTERGCLHSTNPSMTFG